MACFVDEKNGVFLLSGAYSGLISLIRASTGQAQSTDSDVIFPQSLTSIVDCRLIHENSTTTMKNKSGTDPESAQTRKNDNNKSDKESNDFVIGLLTFIIFILFMTAWMYFSN